MRFSYTNDISDPACQQLFDNILINCGVSIEDGNLYLDALLDRLPENIHKFAFCAKQVFKLEFTAMREVRPPTASS